MDNEKIEIDNNLIFNISDIKSIKDIFMLIDYDFFI